MPSDLHRTNENDEYLQSEAWEKNQLISETGNTQYDNWKVPITETVNSPVQNKFRKSKISLKKNSTHMNMFFPDNLIYEMKPIRDIQTKFQVLRKQNTHRSTNTYKTGTQHSVKKKRESSMMHIRETNLAGKTMTKNMSSLSSEPLDLDLRGLERFYDKRSKSKYGSNER